MKTKLLGIVSSLISFVLWLLDLTLYYVLVCWKGKTVLPTDLRREKRQVSVKLPGTNPPIYRNPKNVDRLSTGLEEGVDTLTGAMNSAIKKYPKRPIFKSRPLLNVETTIKKLPNGTEQKLFVSNFGEIVSTTFEEADVKMNNIAKGFCEFAHLTPGKDRIAIFANTCQDWMMIAHAALRANITLVTVYASLGEESLIYSLNEAEVSCLVTEEALLPKISAIAAKVPTLKYVVYIQEKKECDGKKAEEVSKATQIKVQNIREVEQLGSSSGNLPEVTITKDTVAIIMYTSGTTGAPKGVIMTQGALASAIDGIGNKSIEFDIDQTSCYLGILPLAHIFEFVAENFVLCSGGHVGYGSPRTLNDATAKPCGDFTAFKPSIVAGVPRIYDTIKKGIMETVHNPKLTSPVVAWLFDLAYKQKKSALYAGRDTPLWNLLVFNKLKKRLGGNVKGFVAGGAAFHKESQEFLRVVFGAAVVQGYGLTETCAAVAVQCIFDPFKTATNGPAVGCNEFKLESVPDLNYLITSNPPRGEICVRGNSVALGYFKQPQLTSEAFKDGWFLTGDIGEIDENGGLKIIDRKKNLVKLDMGEYVALEKLESVYAQSPFVSPNGICCYAGSDVSFVSALILPQISYCKRYAQENNIEYDEGQDIGVLLPKLKDAVLASLKEEAKKAKFSPHEVVQNITLLNDEWTPENECLTAAMKLKRNFVYKKYDAQIKAMHAKK